MLRIVTGLRAVQNSWGRDPDHVGSDSCVKKLTGVARLLLNRVGKVIRQLVTELARLHLAHLHLHLAWNVVTLLGGGLRATDTSITILGLVLAAVNAVAVLAHQVLDHLDRKKTLITVTKT